MKKVLVQTWIVSMIFTFFAWRGESLGYYETYGTHLTFLQYVSVSYDVMLAEACILACVIGLYHFIRYGHWRTLIQKIKTIRN